MRSRKIQKWKSSSGAFIRLGQSSVTEVTRGTLEMDEANTQKKRKILKIGSAMPLVLYSIPPNQQGGKDLEGLRIRPIKTSYIPFIECGENLLQRNLSM
jgi:hypothetical protein